MFSQNRPVPVNLKQVYRLQRSPLEHAVSANMHAGTPHSFTFSLSGDVGTMTVDNIAESRAPFLFAMPPHGYFSLASNATEIEPGAFRYIRLRANGETLLDIDFTKIQSADELEQYFDCYYFPDLERDRQGIPTPIRQYWGFNTRGHLHCIRERTDRIPINDCGPTCMLTLRHAPIGDFEAEVGFEQCWRRYGIVFGCEKKQFPYYSMLKTWEIAGVQGGFAYVGAHDGGCCVRGALRRHNGIDYISENTNDTDAVSYCWRPAPQVAPHFQSREQATLPHHTLAYCLSGNMRYFFEQQTFTEQAGAVVYLPPNIPCRLEGNPDSVIRVEFDCVEPRALSPAICTPERPETVRRMFEELNDIWHSTLPGKEYRALAVFYRILSEVSRPVMDGATVAIRLATRYIDTQFTKPQLSVKDVAKAAGVSESYLYQLFRMAGEISPKEYILKCRIQHACALLKTQYYKVYEVAEKCGFTDAKYFMTAFKREMGISPTRYITQYRE